jgi:hypothetical protein
MRRLAVRWQSVCAQLSKLLSLLGNDLVERKLVPARKQTNDTSYEHWRQLRLTVGAQQCVPASDFLACVRAGAGGCWEINSVLHVAESF